MNNDKKRNKISLPTALTVITFLIIGFLLSVYFMRYQIVKYEVNAFEKIGKSSNFDDLKKELQKENITILDEKEVPDVVKKHYSGKEKISKYYRCEFSEGGMIFCATRSLYVMCDNENNILCFYLFRT